jgi:hypothetical protein
LGRLGGPSRFQRVQQGVPCKPHHGR